MTDTIDQHGDPLAFRLRQGRGRSPLLGTGRDVIKVEARQLGGHQKEAVVTEGADGTAWRLTSDEGKHLRGTDLAPFPLGFFNAGMQSDLYGRIRALATTRHRARPSRSASQTTTGSPARSSTAPGKAMPRRRTSTCAIRSGVSTETIKALVAAAMDASPAIAFLRASLSGNTFALYINGRRRKVEGVANSPSADAGDPYRAYARAPRPLDPNARRDLIEKTGQVEQGTTEPASATVTNKLIRNVLGEGKSVDQRRDVRDGYLAWHAGDQPFQAGQRRGRHRRRALRPRAALGRHRVLLHDAAVALYREHEDGHSRRAAGPAQPLRRRIDVRRRSRSTPTCSSTARRRMRLICSC